MEGSKTARTIAGGHKEWVEGRWEHESRGWYYIDGHWR